MLLNEERGGVLLNIYLYIGVGGAINDKFWRENRRKEGGYEWF